MKEKDTLYGFTVKNIIEAEDISATIYEMEHNTCGAKLVYLEREDENKTFAIGFKTIPEDSTGVFHILEHSVLCGSKKYPVKEPFVELLKSSLQTFLNAMTYPDKTIYPVSTRNDKDFLNLADVYLDAVLNPAIISCENIFRQEGWHYELTDDGELLTKGVVLNEMRGAYSSPDELMGEKLKSMLFPDTTYTHDSGGNPEHITDLTYEEFLSAHKRYYHPSNSVVFIDGSVKIDEILKLINSYFEKYTRAEVDAPIADQKPISSSKAQMFYELAPSEDKKDKIRAGLAFPSNSFDMREESVALSLIFDVIASASDSRLKKAILDSGLCEDFNIYNNESMKRSFIGADFRNVKDGRWDELRSLFEKTLKEIAKEGIDRQMLTASLNFSEFRFREGDYGRLPKGILYAMSFFDYAMYGAPSITAFEINKLFGSLTEKLSTDYYEKLLEKYLINFEYSAELIMYPSTTLGEERVKAEKEKLRLIKEKMTDKELLEIKKMNEDIDRWQKTPDTKEALSAIPTLRKEDIPNSAPKIPCEIKELCAVKVLSHPIPTEGIKYIDMYFDAADLDESELFNLKLLLTYLGSLGTEKYTSLELKNKIKSSLGAFYASAKTLRTESGETKFNASVSVSVLESKTYLIYDIISEVLYKTSFDDAALMQNILKQIKFSFEDSAVNTGNLFAIRRANAYITTAGAINEYYSGYEFYKRLKEFDENFAAKLEEFKKCARALINKLFTRERLTLSVVGNFDTVMCEKLINLISCGKKVAPVSKIKPIGMKNEGFIVPAQVGFAGACSTLDFIGEKFDGSYLVLKTILSYEYLWNKIRVQGGAYGAGFLATEAGGLGYYSFRDPTPAKSTKTYFGSGEFIREFLSRNSDATDADINKYIIGAVGDAIPLLTPRLKGLKSADAYFSGRSENRDSEILTEILNTDKSALLHLAEELDSLKDKFALCVVGGKDKLESCDFVSEIIELK